MQVPALIGVTVAPLTEQIVGVLLVKVIGNPEELAICNVKGTLFTVALMGVSTVMLWAS